MRSREHPWVSWSSVRPQGWAVMGGTRCPNRNQAIAVKCRRRAWHHSAPVAGQRIGSREHKTHHQTDNQISCKISGGIKVAVAAAAAAFPAAEQPDLWEGSHRQVPAEVGR